MRNIFPIVLTVVISLLISLFCIHQSFGQNYNGTAGKKVKQLAKVIKENHIDYDALSETIIERLPTYFIQELDPNGDYFTVKEVAQIEKLFQEYELPETNKLTYFLEASLSILSNRLDFTLTTLEELSNEEIDFLMEDSVLLNLNYHSNNYTENDSAFKNRWRKFLKWKVLSRGINQGNSKDLEKINDQLNQELQILKGKEVCKIELINQSISKLSDLVLESYLKAYARSFDPHTNYFSIDLISLFFNALSDKDFSSGLIFDKRNGRYVISQIIPFSPASRQSDLIQVGDEIISFFREGEWVDPACNSYNELEQYFFGLVSHEVKVELSSVKDGQVRTFTLAKESIKKLDNHLFSYVFTNEKLNVGYIEFPTFYSDLYKSGNSAGQDLSKAILRLRKKEIEGLIIDLRNNGGGSLKEAIDLAGFFLDYGPLFYVDSKEFTKPELMKDKVRGRVFDGKVIFLVNQFSASASEVLVSSLKQSPNILIVGTQTFGKSTGQQVFPLNLNGGDLPFGSVKVTTTKIYEIDGTSYQGKGITPDIVIPSNVSINSFSEALYPNSLINEPIDRSVKPIKIRDEPIESLKKKSQKRISENKSLSKLKRQSDSLNLLLKKPFYLKFKFDNAKISSDSLNNTISTYQKPYFKIDPIEFDEIFEELSLQLKRKKRNDPVLNETFKIFEDWIDLK